MLTDRGPLLLSHPILERELVQPLRAVFRDHHLDFQLDGFSSAWRARTALNAHAHAWLEDAGILVVEGDRVALTEDWLRQLEDAREAGGELEAEELALRRYRAKSCAYHRRNEPQKSKPSAAGLAAVKRSHEQRQAGLAAMAERAAAAAKKEEQRKAEAFVRDRLGELGRIRLALLQDIWHDAGGDTWSIPRAVEALGCHVEELQEFDNRRFVFAPMEGVA